MSEEEKEDLVECWFCPNQAGSPRIWLRWIFGKRIPVCQECRTQSEMLVNMISSSIHRKTQGR